MPKTGKQENRWSQQTYLSIPGIKWVLFHGKEYLLVVDYFSSFAEMALLSNSSNACVIQHLKYIFARHGIPLVVVSDNGPCYSSGEFQDFAAHYDFKHVTSSSHHAQSNGKAEKGVHIVKLLLKKASEGKADPYLSHLSNRATPLEHGASPIELLMNRKKRTTLPFRMNTKRDKMSSATVRQKQKALQQRQKTNKNAESVIKEWQRGSGRCKLLGQEGCSFGRDKSKIICCQNREWTNSLEKIAEVSLRHKKQTNTAWQERRKSSGLTWRTSTTKHAVFFVFFHTLG